MLEFLGMNRDHKILYVENSGKWIGQTQWLIQYMPFGILILGVLARCLVEID
jgi:hypothetical protein